jgi:hypothetical protein
MMVAICREMVRKVGKLASVVSTDSYPTAF